MEMDTVRGSPIPDPATFTSSSQMLGGQQQVTGRDREVTALRREKSFPQLVTGKILWT